MTDFETTGGAEHQPLRSKREIELSRLDRLLAEAKQEAATVEADAESSADRKRESKNNVRIHEKRRELFLAEHDVTGAWKGDRFGQDLAKLFNGGESFEPDEHGVLRPSPEMQNTRVLLVNMGELDRLNASGDHSVGDAALSITFQKIESAVQAQLRQRHPELTDEAELAQRYSIYRYSGNDFAVILHESSEEITDALRKELISVEMPEDSLDKDPAPLSTDTVSMEEVYAVLNRLRENPGDREQFDAEEKKTTLAIDVLKDLLQTQNDISKNKTRLGRMVEKIRDARSTGTEKKAEEYYKQFQQKALKSLFEDPNYASETLPFDRLVSELEGLRAFDIPPSAAWRHALEERPLEAAIKDLKTRRAESESVETVIQNAAVERLRHRVAAPKGAETPSSFEAPKPTRGKQHLEALRSAANEALKRNQEQPNSMDAYQEAELANLDFQISSAWRDGLTGLERRGPMFDTMEKGFKEGKTVSTLFIDMAFLKYFNNVGGKKVGDVAIQKAAEILDAVAAKYEAQGVTAYRFGGDEFAISIVGGDEAFVQNIRAEIAAQQAEAGPIPAAADSQPGYVPEELVFNIGTSHVGDERAFKQALASWNVKLKKEGTPEERNELADYAIKIADKEVEMYKAMDRLNLLVDRYVKEGETAHFKMIEEYSQKAIFGTDGSAKVREWAKQLTEADGSASLQRVQKEIREFTLEQIDKKNKEKAGYASSVDRLLEDQIRFSYFEKRERELEAMIDGLTSQMAEKDAKIEELHTALRVAQQERETVANLKQKIASA